MSNFYSNDVISFSVNKKRQLSRCKKLGYTCDNCSLSCIYKEGDNALELEKARLEAEAKAKAEAEEKARLEAEAKAKAEAEEKARLEAEAKAKAEAEEKARLEAEAKAKAEAEEKARLEAEAKAKAEAEEKARLEAEAKAKAEAEEKARLEAEAKAKAEAEEKARLEAEAKAKAEAEEKARLEAEAKAKAEAEEKARLEAEAKAKAEAEEKARLEAEAKAKAEAEEKARLEAEAKAKAEAEEKAKEEVALTALPEVSADVEEIKNETEATEEPTEQAEPVAEEKGFKLTNAKDANQILPRIATKRARKLIYAPKEVIFEATCSIDVEGKKNDEGIKVKNILDAEIKEGLKLGYLDKYDGLKMSELKEEYENDTVYELAEQEFKKMGLLLDGNKVKVYLFDWTGNGLHHVGYLPEDVATKVIPYLEDMDKYSFALCGLITGGKCKTITKDEKTGKITVSKGKDGNYGIDLDITIIPRKD
ncbi:MAG: hypothetical protein IKJ19_02665 [Clostridia bacterium]|nr:hypothetical protein [Clostridia bacterium]